MLEIVSYSMSPEGEQLPFGFEDCGDDLEELSFVYVHEYAHGENMVERFGVEIGINATIAQPEKPHIVTCEPSSVVFSDLKCRLVDVDADDFRVSVVECDCEGPVSGIATNVQDFYGSESLERDAAQGFHIPSREMLESVLSVFEGPDRSCSALGSTCQRNRLRRFRTSASVEDWNLIVYRAYSGPAKCARSPRGAHQRSRPRW